MAPSTQPKIYLFRTPWSNLLYIIKCNLKFFVSTFRDPKTHSNIENTGFNIDGYQAKSRRIRALYAVMDIMNVFSSAVIRCCEHGLTWLCSCLSGRYLLILLVKYISI